jgi:lysophospholipase L1-like esterase
MRELSHAGLLALLPLVAVQGTWVRRRTPRLPEAAGVTGSIGRGPSPLRLAVVGDSVAAGVGLAHHEQGIAGQLARRLHGRYGRPVAWTVVAHGGLTAGGVVDLLAARADDLDAEFVVVSVGVNDTKDLHSDQRWTTELHQLLGAVRGSSSPGRPAPEVVLLGVPPMETLPALPRPLAGVLGARSRRLDRLGRELVADLPGVHHLSLADLDLDLDGAHARDGFHPSTLVHVELARRIDILLA